MELYNFPASGSFSAVTDIQPNTQCRSSKKYIQCHLLHQVSIKIFPGKLQQQEMNIGIGPVVYAHGFSYLPVPVGAGTITPAVPNAKDKPGSSCKPDGKQVPFSCFTKSPAAHIKKSKGGMEDEEKYIEEGQPHGYKDKWVMGLSSSASLFSFSPLRSKML